MGSTVSTTYKDKEQEKKDLQKNKDSDTKENKEDKSKDLQIKK